MLTKRLAELTNEFEFRRRVFAVAERHYEKYPTVTSTGYKVPAYWSASYWTNLEWKHREETLAILLEQERAEQAKQSRQ